MQSEAQSGGRLTTHVLDTATGKPARGLRIELFKIDGADCRHLKTTITNDDGRCDSPLLAGAELARGVYELRFHAGDYLGRDASSGPPFLDIIPLRFGIADDAAHYHVPLLLSPFSYSTYRGS